MTTPRRTILMIVESPQKASKIESLLADDADAWVVAATYGHIADIPASDSTAVDRTNGFEPRYELTSSGAKVVADLIARLDGVDAVVLGTDADREGEVIAQHVVDFVVAPGRPELLAGVQRITFDSVTAEGIRTALTNPRSIDVSLVEAARARRVVDRLFGYDVTEVAWRKVNRAATGGRTQSPALRMVVEREHERIAFVPAAYWTIDAAVHGREGVVARSVRVDGTELVTAAAHLNGSEPAEGRLVLDEGRATHLAAATRQLTVTERSEKPATRSPKEPYTFSSLLRDANTRLGMSVAQTKAVGEQLRNAGFITYLRTDSPHLSEEALVAIRAHIVARFGGDHLGDGATPERKSGANVQGAHEAVRPTDIELEVPGGVDERGMALYSMIRERTIASQMARATGRTTTLTLAGGGAEYRLSSTNFDSPGFLRLVTDWETGDEFAVDLDGLDVGSTVGVACGAVRHETKPPARFTEASLIGALEDKGIGRPSTFGDIVGKLLARFVWQSGGSRGPLIPRLSAFAMANLLRAHFAEWVDDDSTKRLEESLDAVANGRADRTSVVAAFMEGDRSARGFGAAVAGASASGDSFYEIAALGTDPSTGEPVTLMAGKGYGNPPVARPYVACGGRTAAVPDTMQLGDVMLEFALERLAPRNRDLGTDPETGSSVWLRNGQFGPYVQLGGDATRGVSGRRKSAVAQGPAPLTASLPADVDPATLDLEGALGLIRVAHRALGRHPETGEMVWLSMGTRYGRTSHFIRCGTETRTVKGDPADVDLAVALALLAVPKPERRGGNRGAASRGRRAHS